MPAKFPARLHAVLASEAPVGLVFRRGPSNAVCTVLWDRAKDDFQLGQWLRGRIYERRADLSPDGRHLIYFARSGGLSSPTRGSYTAIARAPWLKAVALFGKGDCWQGGGLFTSNSTYWLNGSGCHFPLQETKEVLRDLKFKPVGMYGGECPGVYYVRLQRDGWVLKDELAAGLSSAFTVFEKALPHGWVLRKYAHAEVGAPPGKSCYWDEHELEHPRRAHRFLKADWEWAELDGKTLVWAEKGQLMRALLMPDGLDDPRTLFDFNNMKFEPRAAPY